MMRGRRPKPSRIKALTGNPGKRPLNPHEPRPVPAMPECPPELSPVARQEWDAPWRRAVEAEPSHALRSRRARHLLRSLCVLGGSVEQIQKYGTMVKSPTGYPIQSPYLAIANRQAELMIRIASEFGFTPASRSRISAPPPDQLPLLDLTTDDYQEE